MEKLMVVGGHSGDEAVMAGPIAARLIREGGSAVFVSVTNGDGGHHTLGRAEYAVQKDREAKASAARLGAECVLWPISSGSIEVSPERERELASLIRRYTPDTIITHWKDSIHRDHIAAHHLTVNAMRLAASARSSLIFRQEGMVSSIFESSLSFSGMSMFWGQFLAQAPQAMQAEGCLSSGINSIFDAVFTPGA